MSPRQDASRIMIQTLTLLGVVFVNALSSAVADNRHWPLHSSAPAGFTVHGHPTPADGVEGNSLTFDGKSLLTAQNSTDLTGGISGFTLMIWVNPYRLHGQQQMIAAKNRYSLNQRQWGVMIDHDNRFRLYVSQGKWVTADSPTPPQPGHWHLIGVVVRPASAELWVNGKLAQQIELSRPIPNTKAPLTLGGINDNGRVWQNLYGALDEVRLFDSPLSSEQMAAAYTPITATHNVPEPAPQFMLWNRSGTVPKTADAEVLKDVNFHVIKTWEPDRDGYKWLHGVALAWHKQKLYASFGHNEGEENTVTEQGRYCVSADGGQTWSEIRTMDIGTAADDLAVSHGVFLSHGDTLWAFLGAFQGTRQRVHTRAYTLDEGTDLWQPRGVAVDGGFWPMTEPVQLSNGNWIMSGFIVGHGNPAAVAISQGDDLTKWKRVVIDRGVGVGNMWGESSIIVDGQHVVNIARYGDQALALAAISEDFGNTWSPSIETNLPMATSKPCSGILSNGQRYLVCTTTADSRGRRSPLTIAVSRPSQQDFSKIFVIRHAVFAEGPGESNERAALSYPYAIEHNDKLYVGYSNSGGRGGNHNSAELAVIPLRSLVVD